MTDCAAQLDAVISRAFPSLSIDPNGNGRRRPDLRHSRHRLRTRAPLPKSSKRLLVAPIGNVRSGDEKGFHRRRGGHHWPASPRTSRRARGHRDYLTHGRRPQGSREARRVPKLRGCGHLVSSRRCRHEAVSLVTDPDVVIIDASTAHRVADDWTYGFPELDADQAAKVAASKRIANPGCYPTGMIALVRPLVDAGIVSQEVGLVVHAISGYSGGGKQLMAIHQTGEAEPWGAYGAWNREPDEKTSRTLRITS